MSCLRCGRDLAERETWPPDAAMSALTPDEQACYGYCAFCDLFVLR